MKREELREKIVRILVNGGKNMREANVMLHGITMFSDVPDKEAKRLLKVAKKRCKDIPLQYLLKETKFMGLNIRCNKNALIPRPETELMVDIIVRNEKGVESVLDLCCGTGCIGLSIKKHLNVNVDVADISDKALREVSKNAKNNQLDVNIIKSNLFDKINSKYDLIVSNPPYIKTEDIKKLDKEVQKEPVLALDGGIDGYDFYRRIIEKAPEFLNKNGRIYFEVGEGQAKEVSKLLKSKFKNIQVLQDYNDIERIVCATLK